MAGLSSGPSQWSRPQGLSSCSMKPELSYWRGSFHSIESSSQAPAHLASASVRCPHPPPLLQPCLLRAMDSAQGSWASMRVMEGLRRALRSFQIRATSPAAQGAGLQGSLSRLARRAQSPGSEEAVEGRWSYAPVALTGTSVPEGN